MNSVPCRQVDPTLLTNLSLVKEHAGMWTSIPSPSCAYLEGSLLSQFFAFLSSSSPLHQCTPSLSTSGSSLASAALSLSGGRTPFFLLSLSGSDTVSLLARWPISTVTALTLSFCSSAAQPAENR
jgi:hypothetical protein